MNRFEEAGSNYRQNLTESAEARRLAIERLNEIEQVCREGVRSFYGSATETQSPDLYVERVSDNQVNVRYGLRPRAHGIVLRGPMGVIFVTPDGKTLLANFTEWIPNDQRDPDLQGVELAHEGWREMLEDWLIAFMTESEQEYQRVSA